MRLKTINANGRRLGAFESMVYIVKNTVSNYAELSFDDMDKILKAMEENKTMTVEGIRTRSTGYQPDIREPECGDGGGELVLSFGCYEVGNLAKVKEFYEQLKEFNKDPEWKPPVGLAVTSSGNFLKVVDGNVWTCDEDGNNLDLVTSLEDAKKALTAMEYRATLVMPEQPKNFRITGIGAEVRLQYACQVMDSAEVKRLLEELNKNGATTKTEPVAS